MAGRVDYDIEKYQFTEAGETSRLREQWREVYQECRQMQAGAEERLRIALRTSTMSPASSCLFACCWCARRS